MRAGVILAFLPVVVAQASDDAYGGGSDDAYGGGSDNGYGGGSDNGYGYGTTSTSPSPLPIGCPTASPSASPSAGSAYGYGGTVANDDGDAYGAGYGSRRRQLTYDPCSELAQAQNLSVAVAISVSGIACASFGSEEETVFKDGVAATLNGVEPRHVGDVACDDTGRRLSEEVTWFRRRLTDSADLSFELEIPPGELSGIAANATTSAELASSVVSSLATAVSSGALATNIQAAASIAGNTAMASVTATRCVASRASAPREESERRPSRAGGLHHRKDASDSSSPSLAFYSPRLPPMYPSSTSSTFGPTPSPTATLSPTATPTPAPTPCDYINLYPDDSGGDYTYGGGADLRADSGYYVNDTSASSGTVIYPQLEASSQICLEQDACYAVSMPSMPLGADWDSSFTWEWNGFTGEGGQSVEVATTPSGLCNLDCTHYGMSGYTVEVSTSGGVTTTTLQLGAKADDLNCVIRLVEAATATSKVRVLALNNTRYEMARTITVEDGGVVALVGGGNTTVAPAGAFRLFNVEGEGSKLRLDGLTLAGGYSSTFGGAIFAVDATVALRGVTVRDCEVDGSGGAVYALRSTLAFTDVALTSNTAAEYGGAVGLGGNNYDADTAMGTSSSPKAAFTVGSVLTCTRCTLRDNQGKWGGAVSAYATSQAVFDASVASSNSAYQGGFAYASVSGTVFTQGGCVFEANQAISSLYGGSYAHGGAIHLTGNAIADVLDSSFVDNFAEDYGGAIYSATGTIFAESTTFRNNTALTGYGTEIYAQQSQTWLYKTTLSGACSPTASTTQATCASAWTFYSYDLPSQATFDTTVVRVGGASMTAIYTETDIVVRNSDIEGGAAGVENVYDAKIAGCDELDDYPTSACAAAYCSDADTTAAAEYDAGLSVVALHDVGISCYCQVRARRPETRPALLSPVADRARARARHPPPDQTYLPPHTFDPTNDGCLNPPMIDVPTRKFSGTTAKPDALEHVLYFVNNGDLTLEWNVSVVDDPDGLAGSWSVAPSSGELGKCALGNISFALSPSMLEANRPFSTVFALRSNSLEDKTVLLRFASTVTAAPDPSLSLLVANASALGPGAGVLVRPTRREALARRRGRGPGVSAAGGGGLAGVAGDDTRTCRRATSTTRGSARGLGGHTRSCSRAATAAFTGVRAGARWCA